MSPWGWSISLWNCNIQPWNELLSLIQWYWKPSIYCQCKWCFDSTMLYQVIGCKNKWLWCYQWICGLYNSPMPMEINIGMHQHTGWCYLDVGNYDIPTTSTTTVIASNINSIDAWYTSSTTEDTYRWNWLNYCEMVMQIFFKIQKIYTILC